MNPEENNPLTNPDMPDTGASDSFATPPMPPMGGLSTDDSMASAENTLTSAGLAADTGVQTMGLDQISATQPEAIMAPPVEEPLIPAAPVPGSIGSVTSVPPAGASEPTNPGMDMGTGPMPAPEVAPQMPYNPFAPQTSSQPAVAPAPEAAQPVAPKADQPKTRKSTNIPMIILGGAAAILLVLTIIFFVLWRQAVDNPKIVYVPSTSKDEVTAPIRLLSCSRNNDYNYLVGYAQAVNGTETVVASYTNDALQGLSITNQATFNSPEDANVASSNFANNQSGLVASISNSFDAKYDVNESTLNATLESKNGQLAPNDAMIAIYGSADNSPSTAMNDVRAQYEANGFICSVE